MPCFGALAAECAAQLQSKAAQGRPHTPQLNRTGSWHACRLTCNPGGLRLEVDGGARPSAQRKAWRGLKVCVLWSRGEGVVVEQQTACARHAK